MATAKRQSGAPSPFPKNFYFFNASVTAAALRLRRPNDSYGDLGAACVPAIGGTKATKSDGESRLDGGTVVVRSFTSSVRSDFANLKKAAELTESKGSKPNRWDTNSLPVASTVSCEVREGKVTNFSNRQTGEGIFVSTGLVAFQMDSSYDRKTEMVFSLPRLVLDGVTINGQSLKISIDNKLFGRRLSHSKLCDLLDSSRVHPDSDDEHLLTTVVNHIEWAGDVPGVKVDGHRVYVPGFGTIYFGELYSTPSTRRILMVRMDLGSPEGGNVEFGDGHGNGHGIP